MQDVPETVTMTQVQAAARALGLPLDALFAFRVDMSGVTAEVYLLDGDGRKVIHANDAVTLSLYAPIVHEGVPDAAAHG